MYNLGSLGRVMRWVPTVVRRPADDFVGWSQGMGPRCYFKQWCGAALRVRSVNGLAWPDPMDTRASDSSLISTPFEGMPASLGPGLRTVSGASGHSSMFATGSARRSESFSSINTQLALPSAARRRGCARRVFWPWHRPHNTATFRGGSPGVPYFPMTATAVDQHYRRKFLFCSEFQSGCRHARWTWKGAGIRGVWSLRGSGTKTRQNTARFKVRLHGTEQSEVYQNACLLHVSAGAENPAPSPRRQAWTPKLRSRTRLRNPTSGRP